MPEKLRHEAKRSILNGLATALAGCNDAVMDRSSRALAEFAGTPPASVIGRSERFDILSASFLNAVRTNVFDFDDTHPDTIIHPTAPVSPAVFALAERQWISGSRLLEAFILGVEVECRIGNTVSPGHYRRGWHIISTCGVFGAAAAAGKLLQLDDERMLSALGNASTQAGGLVETLGTMSKSIGVGNAARTGLMAKNGESFETARERLRESYGIARFGDPADIANMVVFLCPPMAAYVHGASIDVDGGATRGI